MNADEVKKDINGAFDNATVGSGGDKKPCELCEIVSVQYLNGDDKDKNAELGSDTKHWVNLPRDKKWVDKTNVTSIDRLSQQPRIKVRFNSPGKHKFKLKYVPDPGNVAYSAGEKGRNSNFKYEETEKTYITGADGTKIIDADFRVTAAGTHKYQVVATDEKGKEVKSFNLETFRLVHYKELKMRTLVSIASNLSAVESEFQNQGVQLVAMARVEMDHIPNISPSAPKEKAILKEKARAAYAASDAKTKEPYVVAVAYTDHLATKDSNQTVVKSGVKVGPTEPDVQIPIVNAAGDDRCLWNKIVPGEGWFVSAKFLKDGGKTGTDDVVIAEADCTPVSSYATVPDKCRTVKINVTKLAAATGTITLEVNWVSGMAGGVNYPDGNLICVCTRAWWTDISEADQNRIMIHEMGHKIRMVPDGSGKLPDKTATHYTAKGHTGPHCHHGLAVKADYSKDSGTCVMFGRVCGVNAFCTDCAPAAKKQDVSAGWPAF